MPELDLEKITEALMKLAGKALSGEEITQVKYRVTVDIPEEIADTLDVIAEQSGVTINELLGKLATEGINDKIRKNSIVQAGQPATSSPTPELFDGLMNKMKESGLDLSGLMGQMNNIKDLAKDLQGLEGIVKNATESTRKSQERDDSGKNPKNSK